MPRYLKVIVSHLNSLGGAVLKVVFSNARHLTIESFDLLHSNIFQREEARLNDLRERYEVFLEEEKQRRERNERILQTLDRIESRAAILTAKSERLRLLRVNEISSFRSSYGRIDASSSARNQRALYKSPSGWMYSHHALKRIVPVFYRVVCVLHAFQVTITTMNNGYSVHYRALDIMTLDIRVKWTLYCYGHFDSGRFNMDIFNVDIIP
ncbi:hypothetical protein ANN_01986 [Periplaneta americana]|uniref:Uncharacterized protein n=1 Tax=Periplaneta americana TaxID=6978 RepID=A0ABQ8TYH2_PERAM|nr:hypothetical protein ANN_01986 [Periplaneta americana]